MSRVPVTVVTGALGAGKTSLINHLLQSSDRKLAVIVNEFGDIGIDGDLIESGAEDLIELNAGCVCCVVRGDLIRTLRDLLRRDLFNGIVIETTGLAHPGPVIQSFYADQQLAARCRLDAVVAVVDAIHAPGQLDEPDIADQVALSTTILLNKASEAQDLETLKSRLRAINPLAVIVETDRGWAAPDRIFDQHAFELDTERDMPEVQPRHDHSASALCLSTDDPMDAEALERWLSELLALRGKDILRTKGIICVAGEERRLVVQAVHMMLEGDLTSPWPGPGPRTSRLVFIGRELDTDSLRADFLACCAKVTA